MKFERMRIYDVFRRRHRRGMFWSDLFNFQAVKIVMIANPCDF